MKAGCSPLRDGDGWNFLLLLERDVTRDPVFVCFPSRAEAIGDGKAGDCKALVSAFLRSSGSSGPGSGSDGSINSREGFFWTAVLVKTVNFDLSPCSFFVEEVRYTALLALESAWDAERGNWREAYSSS